MSLQLSQYLEFSYFKYSKFKPYTNSSTGAEQVGSLYCFLISATSYQASGGKCSG